MTVTIKKTTMRRICVVTGTRAEYGIFKPLLHKITKNKRCRLQLVVTGMHLLHEYGATIKHIAADGFPIAARVPMYKGKSGSNSYYSTGLARAVTGLGSVFNRLQPDFVVVLGDRPEALAAAIAASFAKIPLAHIQGGDRTDSADIDESIRHAITRFAHLHFAASAEAARRLRRSGEEAWRIHEVGALGVDSALAVPRCSRPDVYKRLQIPISNKPLVVCLFHPIHLKPTEAGKQMQKILAALREVNMPTVIIFPNNDAGNKQIIKEIKRNQNNGQFVIFTSLSHATYIQLLRSAAVLIGNTSSGIIEAPALRLPFVSVGDRQKNRAHAANVITSIPKVTSIIRALKQALTNKHFLSAMQKRPSPYGYGGASKAIVRVLVTTALNEELLEKRLTY